MDIIKIHHILQVAFLPPYNGIFVAALACLKIKSKKYVGVCLLFASLFIYIQYTPLFALELTKLVYPKYNKPVNPQNLNPQAIVVLGAGVEIALDDLGEVKGLPAGSTLLNVESAAIVAQEFPSLPIILSGGGYTQKLSEAEAMNEYLQTHYELVNTRVIESQSKDTYENAKFTVMRLKEDKIDKVILVTQASHMWRSKALFHKYGVIAIEYPAWDKFEVRELKWWQMVLPRRSAEAQTKKLIHEIIGYLVYAI